MLEISVSEVLKGQTVNHIAWMLPCPTSQWRSRATALKHLQMSASSAFKDHHDSWSGDSLKQSSDSSWKEYPLQWLFELVFLWSLAYTEEGATMPQTERHFLPFWYSWAMILRRVPCQPCRVVQSVAVNGRRSWSDSQGRGSYSLPEQRLLRSRKATWKCQLTCGLSQEKSRENNWPIISSRTLHLAEQFPFRLDPYSWASLSKFCWLLPLPADHYGYLLQS